MNSSERPVNIVYCSMSLKLTQQGVISFKLANQKKISIAFSDNITAELRCSSDVAYFPAKDTLFEIHCSIEPSIPILLYLPLSLVHKS